MSVRVRLPQHLRTLAQVEGEVTLDVALDAEGGGLVTTAAVLDALEARYPVLQGAIRDRATGKRRPFVRFFVGEDDVSHEPADAPLPDSLAEGREVFHVIGAMAGG
jgi:hypothetical protein